MDELKLDQKVLDYLRVTMEESFFDTFKPRYIPGTWDILPGSWENLPGSFRNIKKDESVEKFIN